MKVTELKAPDGALRAKHLDADMTRPFDGPKDRVSVRESKDAEAVVAAARAAGGRHSARAERLEADVKAGVYRPDAGRIAEQLLADAEIDARMFALLNR